jgi:adenylate cyclase
MGGAERVRSAPEHQNVEAAFVDIDPQQTRHCVVSGLGFGEIAKRLLLGQATMERRLAAILASDVVGYSRLMQLDEAGTLAALAQRRNRVLEPLVVKYHGRIVKVMGDGVLIEFPSAVNAVACAVELQGGMQVANADLPEDRQIVLRVGINLGDVMAQGSDLYGDGVNIAARLEAMAEPGSIFVSQAVFNHVRGKTKVAFEDLGEQSLKNMAEPVRVYRIGSVAEFAPRLENGRARPAKLSIAVLPFVNMSGDPEQEYFSDGITEDIITDLSKVSALKVLSRNTVFTFKGKSVDVGQITRQLKVGHVLEGSVRKAGGRVRITAQLINADDNHVWAERFDRDLSDIFALQDEISERIVAALKVKLLPEEKKAIETRSTQDLKAYQLYLLARYYQMQIGARAHEIAIRFAQGALAIDPNYARAWALVGLCQAFLYIRGRSEESGLSAAEKALSLDASLPEAHAAKGRALAELGRFDEALAAHEESLSLEPDSFDVRFHFGRTCMLLGRHEAAIAHYERAAQLVEADYVALSYVAGCHIALGRHAEGRVAAGRALERIEREIALRPDNANATALGAINLVYLKEKERSKEWASRALTVEPDDPLVHYNLACAMALMNETDLALDLLEGCAGKMAPIRINWIKQDPDLTPLHHEPRYQALVARGEARLRALQSEQAAKAH